VRELDAMDEAEQRPKKRLRKGTKTILPVDFSGPSEDQKKSTGRIAGCGLGQATKRPKQGSFALTESASRF